MRQRYIPEGSKETVYPEISGVVYTRELAGKWCAVGYGGKRTKPDFNYWFRSPEQREKHINEWVNNLQKRKEYRDSQKAKRQAFTHTLKEGDILYSSWGYEQTNIDFYQVTKVVSNKTVKIRRINSSFEEQTGFMSGRKVAVKDSFKEGSEEMLKRVNEGNWISLNSYSGASLWDGTPMNYSWYA